MRIPLLLITGLLAAFAEEGKPTEPLKDGFTKEGTMVLENSDGRRIGGIPVRAEGDGVRFLRVDTGVWQNFVIPVASLSEVSQKHLKKWLELPRLVFRGLYIGMTQAELKKLYGEQRLFERGRGMEGEILTINVDFGSKAESNASELATDKGKIYACRGVSPIRAYFYQGILIMLDIRGPLINDGDNSASAWMWCHVVENAFFEKYGAKVEKAKRLDDDFALGKPMKEWDVSPTESALIGIRAEGEKGSAPVMVYSLRALKAAVNAPPGKVDPVKPKGNL